MRSNGPLEETLIDETALTTCSAEIKIDGSNDGVNWRTFNAPDNTNIVDNNGTVIRTTSEYDASGSGRFDPKYLRVWVDVASGTVDTITAKLFARNY